MTERGYQADFYDLCAKMRDRENRLWKAAKINYSITRFGAWPAERLAAATCIDVGCSSGIMTNQLAPLFRRIIGVEYDAVAMRNLDAPWAPNSAYAHGDAMALPFASSSADVVICSQVYEHVPDDVRLWAEIYRILKPGGMVFFSGPNRLFPWEFHYSLPFFHWLPGPLADATLRLLGKGDHFYEHLRTIWTLRKVLARFRQQDVTVDLLVTNPAAVLPQRLAGLVRLIPAPVWRLLLPLFPNFNMLLYKPG